MSAADRNYAVETVGHGSNIHSLYVGTMLDAMREADWCARNQPSWVRFIPTNHVLYIGKERPNVA